MVVYADVLIAVNIIITYIFLVGVRLVSGFGTNKAGVGAASLVGGLSSLVVLLGERGIAFSLLYRLCVAVAIVLLAFMPERIKGFLKLLFLFLGITFLSCGVLYGVIILFSPDRVTMINGIPYFNMSVKLLIGVVLLIYGCFMVFDYFFMRHVSKADIYPVVISFRNVSVHLSGFLDTGNSLKDGFNQKPVIVAELSGLKPLFNETEFAFLSGEFADNPPNSLETRYRLTPCKTVSGCGLLKGFVTDYVEIKSDKGSAKAKGLTVAVVCESLSDGEYNVLLSKSVFDMNWEENKRDKGFRKQNKCDK